MSAFLGVKAQSTDLEFANYYFENAEFDKAILYYEKLNNQQANPFYYQRLMQCFVSTLAYEKAEDLAKRQLKKTPLKSDVYVDLALVYRKQANDKKALKAFDDALDEMPNNRAYIVQIARKLIDLGELDYAEKTYEKGAGLLKDDYNFALELADLYGAKGNLPKMIDSFVLLVSTNPAYVPSVEYSLSRYLNLTEEPEQADLVRKSLLRALQKDPNNTTYNEMLVWLFYQTKNFEGAFTQLKALDKRFQENGNRLLDFARLCVNNEEYSLAYDAYVYLSAEKSDQFVVQQAKIGKAKTSFARIEQILIPKPEQLLSTSFVLSTTLTELGITNASVELLTSYAQFLAKYENKLDSAILLLESAIEKAQLSEQSKASVKLLLGDFLIISGDIWEASLLYSQVDKSFKDDILGAEAKFRNAKVAYYSGDFKWAQDQLDVLKASTSKLISNDAMNLSLLITDNLGRDSIEEPLKLFALADLYAFQHLDNEALAILDSLKRYYPQHPLADELLFRKAEIASNQKQFKLAAEYLQQIVDNYPSDLLGDDAAFKLAQLYELILGDKEKAKALYEKIITEYPGSLYTVEARKQYRLLRGDAQSITP